MKNKRKSLILLGLAFCLSGIASLNYQVAWQRILVLHSGVGIYSVSVVVSVFMAGLGFGSYYGGVYSSKISKKNALKVFALIEFLISIIGFFSCFIYYDCLYMNVTWLYSSLLTMIPTHFASLIIPTFLMGMSLPFLVHGTVYDYKKASRTIGILYGLNITGAVLGAFLTPWILIPAVGIPGSVYIAAGCNLVAGLIALFTSQYAEESISPTEVGTEQLLTVANATTNVDQLLTGTNPNDNQLLTITNTDTDQLLTVTKANTNTNTDQLLSVETANANTYSLSFWIVLYTLSGFIALALEILWFRILDVAVKSNAFTFGTILSVYLLGLGLGTFIGSKLSTMNKRPLSNFLLYQSIILIYTCLSILFICNTSWDIGYSDFWMLEYLDGLWIGTIRMSKEVKFYLHVLLALYFCLIPTIFMGLSFTVLQKAVHNSGDAIGERVGILQSFNILGNVLGSLAIGLFLLESFGTIGSLTFLIVMGLIFPITGIIFLKNKIPFYGISILIIGLLLVLPSSETLWARFHGAPEDRMLFSEKSSGLVSVLKSGAGGYTYYINGKYHSQIPFGGAQGVAGAIAHPNPKKIALVGLGSGSTAWALGCRKGVEEITVYEVVLANDILEICAEDNIELKNFLEDDRVTILEEDGRNALSRTNEKFDIIEASALRPMSAYAGNLYSEEFFQLCYKRLNDSGIMVQMQVGPRALATFAKVFPYIYSSGNRIMIGSKQPLDFDSTRIINFLSAKETETYLGEPRAKFLSTYFTSNPFRLIEENHINAGLLTNSDLYPRDEFTLVNIFYQ